MSVADTVGDRGVGVGAGSAGTRLAKVLTFGRRRDTPRRERETRVKTAEHPHPTADRHLPGARPRPGGGPRPSPRPSRRSRPRPTGSRPRSKHSTTRLRSPPRSTTPRESATTPFRRRCSSSNAKIKKLKARTKVLPAAPRHAGQRDVSPGAARLRLGAAQRQRLRGTRLDRPGAHLTQPAATPRPWPNSSRTRPRRP